MAHAVTSFSSSWLTGVNQLTAIRKDDGMVRGGVKILTGTCAKITLCILSMLECIGAGVLMLCSMPLSLIAPKRWTKQTEYAASAWQTVFRSCGALFQVHAHEEVDATWRGQTATARLKKGFRSSYLKICNFVRTHPSTITLAGQMLAVCACVYYAGFHNVDVIKTIKNRVFTLLGLHTPTLPEYNTQLWKHVTSSNYQQFGKTLQHMTQQYAYEIGMGGVSLFAIVILVFFCCRQRSIGTFLTYVKKAKKQPISLIGQPVICIDNKYYYSSTFPRKECPNKYEILSKNGQLYYINDKKYDTYPILKDQYKKFYYKINQKKHYVNLDDVHVFEDSNTEYYYVMDKSSCDSTQ